MAGNPWVNVGLEASLLSLEASHVIALRTLKLAAGGAAAKAEMRRMFAEKVVAASMLQSLAVVGALGFTARAWLQGLFATTVRSSDRIAVGCSDRHRLPLRQIAFRHAHGNIAPVLVIGRPAVSTGLGVRFAARLIQCTELSGATCGVAR
jgi:hypothetical protein